MLFIVVQIKRVCYRFAIYDMGFSYSYRLLPLLLFMASQPNSIYLSTNHDVIEVLPSVLLKLLNQVGFTIKSAIHTFDQQYPPLAKTLTDISSCDNFLLLLTKGVCVGSFGSYDSDQWLSGEIQCARKNNKKIIILLGYGLTQENLSKDQWIWSRIVGEQDEFIELSNHDIHQAMEEILTIIHAENGHTENTPFHEPLLNAEEMIDTVYWQRHDALLYNRPMGSEETIESCVQQFSDYHRVYFERANEFRHTRKKEKLQEIIADFTKAIELSGGTARYYAARANALYQQHSLDHADVWGHSMADINIAIRLSPNVASYYVQRASQLDYMHRISQLEQPSLMQIHDYSKAIELHPKSQFLYERRAKVYQQLERYDDALQDIEQAIAHDNYGHKAHYMLMRGFILLSKGQREQAILTIREVIATEQNENNSISSHILQVAASFYRQIQDYEQTTMIYDQLIEQSNDSMERPMAYIERAKVNLELGNYQTALEDLDSAIASTTHPFWKANSYYHQGITFSEIQDWENAIKSFTKSIELHNDFTDAYRQRAEVRQNLHDYRGAYKDIQMALKLQPENDKYKKIRDQIMTLL